MAEPKTSNREKVKEIVAGIESGIKELFQSDRYADYLRTMSRFHNYSYRNTLLIHMQRPDATLVAGFNKWKNQFQRHVKKGEKGMTILATTPFKKKIEQQKLDPDTKAPLLDEEGNILTEEKTVEIPMFRPVKVFDVKQTDGKPLPSLAVDLTGDVRHYEAFLEALRRTSPVPIDFKPISGNMNGYFSPARQRIAIQEGMSEVQTVCTGIHEITHAILHNQEEQQQAAAAGTDAMESVNPKDEQTREVEAESVSYSVCQYYNIETSANSLGYIAHWSSGKELPELKASLETISKTANYLITEIDRHFAEVCKERGIVLEQAESSDMAVPSEESSAGNASAAEEAAPSKAETEVSYLYCSEYNPQHVGKSDFRLIRARTLDDEGPSPDQVLFVGSAELCDKLLDQLTLGRLRHDDFFHVNTARVSHYRTKDGAELDAFVAPDDKVYLGRRDHYDNRGHYLNHDKSLLHVSDNPQMFRFISGTGYTETQAELLEEGYFTPEDYAEYAALQTDVLSQFKEAEPLLFGGEPFCFIPLDPSEVNLDAPVLLREDTALDEYPMPDPAYSKEDVDRDFACLEGYLLPLSKERAEELMERDFSIYAIVNEYARMVFDLDELNELPPDTVCAMPTDEWEGSADFRQAAASRMERQEEREQAFLRHAGDCFAIYQLRQDDSTRYLRYEPLERIQQAGESPRRENYELAYTGELAFGLGSSALERLWDKFNNAHPADYLRPSMSVSDIIAVKQDGVVSCHYCDSMGFAKVPDFIKPENYLKAAELSTEDDCNMIDGIINNGPKEPTVAELEAQVKAGQRISLMDLAGAVHREQEMKKKSVVSQLKGKPPQKRQRAKRQKSSEKGR